MISALLRCALKLENFEMDPIMKDQLQDFDIFMGISTGNVCCGSIGSELRIEYVLVSNKVSRDSLQPPLISCRSIWQLV